MGTTAKGTSAALVADTAVSTWQKVAAALSPIIGQAGVGALLKRSLYLVRADYPFLTAAYEGAHDPGDLGALHAALAQQTGTDAAAAHSALLQTFHDLLISLIGGSLTERLLRPVWDDPSSGDAVQDTLP